MPPWCDGSEQSFSPSRQADKYGIEYFGVGADRLVYNQRPEGFSEKMDAIYDEAQARYNGKMGMLLPARP